MNRSPSAFKDGRFERDEYAEGPDHVRGMVGGKVSAQGEGGDEVGTAAGGRGGDGARTSCLSGRGTHAAPPRTDAGRKGHSEACL